MLHLIPCEFLSRYMKGRRCHCPFSKNFLTLSNREYGVCAFRFHLHLFLLPKNFSLNCFITVTLYIGSFGKRKETFFFFALSERTIWIYTIWMLCGAKILCILSIRCPLTIHLQMCKPNQIKISKHSNLSIVFV